MDRVKITGIGLVSCAGTSSRELWESLLAQEQRPRVKETRAVEFKPDFPSARLRRMNRYCRLALYAAKEAWKDGGSGEEADPFLRGTIFTTGYGSMEAELKFSREVIKEDPDVCSPTVFTGIVPNSCVGTVCMFLNCKGVSTMLEGGDHLEYSSLLLREGRADYILAGSVEEYSRELFASLQRNPCADGARIEEGTVVFCLERGQGGYATLVHTVSAGLPCFPLISYAPEEGCGQIKEAVLACLAGAFPDAGPEAAVKEIDAVFTSANGTYFDMIEQKALSGLFAKDKIVDGVKAVTGETMGSGLSMNVAAAALCLSHGFVPRGLQADGKSIKNIHRVLAVGYDVAGNYSCCILEGCNNEEIGR